MAIIDLGTGITEAGEKKPIQGRIIDLANGGFVSEVQPVPQKQPKMNKESLSRRRDQPRGRRTHQRCGPERCKGWATGPQRGWG